MTRAQLLQEVLHLGSVLRCKVAGGPIPQHMRCGLMGHERHHITAREISILSVHGYLLCPCGGKEFSVTPLGRRRAVR